MGQQQTVQELSNQMQRMNESQMCLPWTWYLAVYMQLCLLLALTICLLTLGPLYQIICLFLHIGFFIYSTIRKAIIINDIASIIEETGNSKIGLLRPSRNIFLFAQQFILPFEYYNSFFLFGVLPGYLFFCYLEKEINEESIQERARGSVAESNDNSNIKVYQRSGFGPYRSNMTTTHNHLMITLKQWKKSNLWRFVTFLIALIIWIFCTYLDHNYA